MIFTLSDTDTHEIARTLVEIRDDGSQGTTSRVLTLIAVAKDTDNIRSVISVEGCVAGASVSGDCVGDGGPGSEYPD